MGAQQEEKSDMERNIAAAKVNWPPSSHDYISPHPTPHPTPHHHTTHLLLPRHTVQMTSLLAIIVIYPPAHQLLPLLIYHRLSIPCTPNACYCTLPDTSTSHCCCCRCCCRRYCCRRCCRCCCCVGFVGRRGIGSTCYPFSQGNG